MISNYIYFNTLSRIEQCKQLSFILMFLFVLLIVFSFLFFIKIQFTDDSKKTLFQKFLKKL